MKQQSFSSFYFMQGGGEMGETIRSIDWSKTPPGPAEQWPQSLRTAIGIMLENPLGICVAWGADYIQLHNDGYRSILGGGGHTGAQGISARETFSEIWQIIGPGFDRAMEGQATAFSGFMIPLSRDGHTEECFFDLSYSPIRKEDGEVGGVFLTVAETTAKIADEKARDLMEANFRLERSNAELEQFAYVASHDLQEPLRKIKAFGDMLKNRYSSQLGPEGADMIERMQSASARMRGLIDDLLSFSRVSANKNSYLLVDISEVIREVLNDMETTIREKNGLIHVDPFLPVTADPLQLRQLFQNIISNSLKFIKPGMQPVINIRSGITTGSKSHFKVSKEDLSKKFQHITISDNGIGFEQEYSKRIFQVFHRLHGRAEYPGTGMGLSIVQKVVENHHGYISATGRPGEGTTIDILLPVG